MSKQFDIGRGVLLCIEPYSTLLFEYLTDNFSENGELNPQVTKYLQKEMTSCRRESELKMTFHSPA